MNAGRGEGGGGSSLRGGRMAIGCNLNITSLFILFCVFVCVVLCIDNQRFQGQTVSSNQSSFVSQSTCLCGCLVQRLRATVSQVKQIQQNGRSKDTNLSIISLQAYSGLGA
jgi:hypothetical protein